MHRIETLTREIESKATINESHYVAAKFREPLENGDLTSLDFVAESCLENWLGDLEVDKDGKRGEIYFNVANAISQQRCEITDELTDCLLITYIVM